MVNDQLIQKAIKMRSRSRALYSNYNVGAAVETENGDIIGGCNVETSSYGLTCCAEQVALFRAISEGYNSFKAFSVATENGGMPCGACRQVIWELCGNIPIYICNKNGLIKSVTSKDLIPDPFDNTKLM
jgi:cytidine deaminase|tara:strand:- start:399 stop:785 length:387 start_codon:yes stop_codon:yes gene_type:complete